MHRHRFLILAILVAGSRRTIAQANPTPKTPTCVFSSFYKSSLAWESGLAQGNGPSTSAGGGDLVGRVIAVRDGEGMAGARVRVLPGMRLAATDSAGRFAIHGLPQGRYFVTVVAPPRSGAASISDSVTIGFDGLRLVASLSSPTGDIVCTTPARQPSNER
jgi:hypothetical protein